MKIAVCVKEVPDAGPNRRIDPGTLRMDRSGDRSLNAYDLHAVEQAIRLKDAAGDGEVILVSMGAEPGARVAPEGPRDGRRPRPAGVRRRGRRLRPGRNEQGARQGDRVRVARPGALRPAGHRRRRRRAVGRRGRPAEAAGRLPDLRARGLRRQRHGEAPDRARLRHDPHPAAGGAVGGRLAQRAALPVAQGHHGREEEAAGHEGARRHRRGRRRRPARPARAPPSSGLGEPPSRGDTIKIEDEGDAAQKILDFLVERKLV